MISVVIATLDDERTLGQTLASLVPAAVDGLVREVILADGGSTDDTLEIAEDAGARVTPCAGSAAARSAEGCKAARSDWILLLRAVAPAPEGWEAAVAAHLNGASGKAASWGGGPWPFSRTPDAVLAPRRLYERHREAGEDLLRRLASGAVRLKPGR